jgi:hypothetical protein
MPSPDNVTPVSFCEDAGFLLCNLSSADTGIDGAVAWIAAGEFTRPGLGPRIAVVVGEKLTVDTLAQSVDVRLTTPPEVLGTLPPRVAAQAVEFVTRNRAVLLEYWKGEMGTSNAIDLLIRV